MVKRTQTIRWLLPTSFLTVFDQFVGLALKGFKVEFSNKVKDGNGPLDSEKHAFFSAVTRVRLLL